jgi:hypothetical protein
MDRTRLWHEGATLNQLTSMLIFKNAYVNEFMYDSHVHRKIQKYKNLIKNFTYSMKYNINEFFLA